MTTKHEPREGFAERLEWQIATEVRRRNRVAEAPGWLPRSPRRVALAAGLLVVISMVAGGAVVAAAYQAKANEQRDLIAAALELRLKVAQARMDTAKAELIEVEKRVATGIEQQESRLVAQLKITAAETEMRTLQMQIEEVRLSGREPRPEITAPMVSGRDFVAQRLEAEVRLAASSLDLEKARLQAWERRWNVGMATSIDVATAQSRVVELEAAVRALQEKIDVRRRFSANALTAAQADLRVLEIEAEQRVRALQPKLDLAKQSMQLIARRVEIGTFAPLDLAQARLRVAEIEADLAKAQLDLTLIRKRLDEAR